MNERTPQSRHLPAWVHDRLAELEAGPKVFDGQSSKWARALTKPPFEPFAKIEIVHEEKRTTISAELTERGKIALERDRRGVDPWLVMT